MLTHDDMDSRWTMTTMTMTTRYITWGRECYSWLDVYYWQGYTSMLPDNLAFSFPSLIGLNHLEPVVSSCNILTIPLVIAKAMNPAPCLLLKAEISWPVMMQGCWWALAAVKPRRNEFVWICSSAMRKRGLINLQRKHWLFQELRERCGGWVWCDMVSLLLFTSCFLKSMVW